MAGIPIKIRGLEKRFAANRVLRGVDLDIPAGKVTVLMGANGAGKSTLVKIICGLYAADAGQVELNGKPFAPTTPSEALQAGIVTVHQNINDGVVPDLDVASNLMLDWLANPKSAPVLNPRKIRRSAEEIAAKLGLNFDMNMMVSDLTLADRQLVAIARAMAHEPKLMILDEPTSSLSASEAERLFALVDKLREGGVAILYISHRMSDIRRVADRIVSMRDGTIVGQYETEPLDYEGAVNDMLGHTMTDVDITVQKPGEKVLELENVQLKPESKPINLNVHRNEVIAITGLVGVGKTQLTEVLFGQTAAAGGTVRLKGESYTPKSARDAINQGVFLCAKDRGTNGVVQDFDINRNITLPFLSSLSTLGFVRRRAEYRITNEAISKLGIVCQSANDDIGTLSGGNQQKVMVGRWLSHPSDVLILDEPFQGVDIAARRDIGTKLRETAKDRATIVLVAELDEALEIADRILVMAEFTIVGEHKNENVDVDLILEQVSGAAAPQDLQEQKEGAAR
ncbi:sugar ABC transporter ATP-binding protein [Maritalea mediterranea]|uniref:Sugar ABC transporter ATP-binding protein n=1 Tax=Maritalea mediterranea TaxID=2909667 RepID=A0ABS9E6S2_9HYPH|nr:sugar ABC transporter ATP-binding protein [Maritalea mediterranea]MCF4097156.1 sugar ABC transporter ATP-binding protein [Maritalea mediterranea]